MPDADVSLSDAIKELRDELIEAQDAGARKSMRFSVEEIDLELQLVVSSKVEGGAKVGWKVLGANVGADRSTANTHRLQLKLKLAPDEDGTDPRISGEGPPPPRG